MWSHHLTAGMAESPPRPACSMLTYATILFVLAWLNVESSEAAVIETHISAASRVHALTSLRSASSVAAATCDSAKSMICSHPVPTWVRSDRVKLSMTVSRGRFFARCIAVDASGGQEPTASTIFPDDETTKCSDVDGTSGEAVTLSSGSTVTSTTVCDYNSETSSVNPKEVTIEMNVIRASSDSSEAVLFYCAFLFPVSAEDMNGESTTQSLDSTAVVSRYTWVQLPAEAVFTFGPQLTSHSTKKLSCATASSSMDYTCCKEVTSISDDSYPDSEWTCNAVAENTGWVNTYTDERDDDASSKMIYLRCCMTEDDSYANPSGCQTTSIQWRGTSDYAAVGASSPALACVEDSSTSPGSQTDVSVVAFFEAGVTMIRCLAFASGSSPPTVASFVTQTDGDDMPSYASIDSTPLTGVGAESTELVLAITDSPGISEYDIYCAAGAAVTHFDYISPVLTVDTSKKLACCAKIDATAQTSLQTSTSSLYCRSPLSFRRDTRRRWPCAGSSCIPQDCCTTAQGRVGGGNSAWSFLASDVWNSGTGSGIHATAHSTTSEPVVMVLEHSSNGPNSFGSMPAGQIPRFTVSQSGSKVFDESAPLTASDFLLINQQFNVKVSMLLEEVDSSVSYILTTIDPLDATGTYVLAVSTDMENSQTPARTTDFEAVIGNTLTLSVQSACKFPGERSSDGAYSLVRPPGTADNVLVTPSAVELAGVSCTDGSKPVGMLSPLVTCATHGGEFTFEGCIGSHKCLVPATLSKGYVVLVEDDPSSPDRDEIIKSRLGSLTPYVYSDDVALLNLACRKGHGVADDAKPPSAQSCSIEGAAISIDNPCVPCAAGHFQPAEGSIQKCTPCPSNSYSTTLEHSFYDVEEIVGKSLAQAVSCRCKEGFTAKPEDLIKGGSCSESCSVPMSSLFDDLEAAAYHTNYSWTEGEEPKPAKLTVRLSHDVWEWERAAKAKSFNTWLHGGFRMAPSDEDMSDVVCAPNYEPLTGGGSKGKGFCNSTHPTLVIDVPCVSVYCAYPDVDGYTFHSKSFFSANPPAGMSLTPGITFNVVPCDSSNMALGTDCHFECAAGYVARKLKAISCVNKGEPFKVSGCVPQRFPSADDVRTPMIINFIIFFVFVAVDMLSPYDAITLRPKGSHESRSWKDLEAILIVSSLCFLVLGATVPSYTLVEVGAVLSIVSLVLFLTGMLKVFNSLMPDVMSFSNAYDDRNTDRILKESMRQIRVNMQQDWQAERADRSNDEFIDARPAIDNVGRIRVLEPAGNSMRNKATVNRWSELTKDPRWQLDAPPPELQEA